MARRYSSNPSGSMLNIAIIVLILVVIGLGVFAVWDKVSTGIRQYSVNNGGEYTVEEVADQSGMEVNDFLNYYGVGENEGITGKSKLSDIDEKLTLENYSKLYFATELTDDEFAAFKAEKGIADDVAKDTKDMDVKTQYAEYAYAKQMAESATQSPDGTSADGSSVTIPAADSTGTDESTETAPAAESTADAAAE